MVRDEGRTVKYQGSKSRLAKPIAAVIRPALTPGTRYVEPFLGSAAVAVELSPYAQTSALSEGHEDVALMWQALLSGWEPPLSVTVEEYRAQREAPPSAARGFIGTVCSFGGKWFGGYAREGARGDVNFADVGRRSVLRRAETLRAAHVQVAHCDYRSTAVSSSDVVYLDPPYAGTLAYKAMGAFDSVEFWKHARAWVDCGARVYVSEFNAPSEWVSVWSRNRQIATDPTSYKRATDCLFVHESQVP